MYKKSANLIHLHERTASHATKGLATGLVKQRKLDETDFYSEVANLLRWSKIKALKKFRCVHNQEYWHGVETLKICKNEAARDNLLLILKPILKRIREIDSEISELRACTEKPTGKVRKTFSSPEDRRRYYQQLHAKDRKRLT